MTGTVTDINQHRKVTATTNAFDNWTDNRFRTRLKLLALVRQDGLAALTLVDPKLAKFVFPNGYDPVAHPEDNHELIEAEAERRGVAIP